MLKITDPVLHPHLLVHDYVHLREGFKAENFDLVVSAFLQTDFVRSAYNHKEKGSNTKGFIDGMYRLLNNVGADKRRRPVLNYTLNLGGYRVITGSPTTKQALDYFLGHFVDLNEQGKDKWYPNEESIRFQTFNRLLSGKANSELRKYILDILMVFVWLEIGDFEYDYDDRVQDTDPFKHAIHKKRVVKYIETAMKYLNGWDVSRYNGLELYIDYKDNNGLKLYIEYKEDT